MNGPEFMTHLPIEKNLDPHIRLRKWFYRITFWALALSLLMALLRKTDWHATLSILLGMPVQVIVFCAAGWYASFLFRALRFQTEWQYSGRIAFFDALKVTFIHNAAVVLVPFRVGEFGYPMLVRRLLPVTWQQCIRSLLWLRLQDGTVLLSISFLLVPIGDNYIKLGALAFAALLIALTRQHWLKLLRSRHFMVQQMRAFLHQRSDWRGWVLSVANWLVKLCVVSVMLQQFMNVTQIQAVRGALTGELSALLPLTGPAGLGTYELGVWSGLGLSWSEMQLLVSSVLFTHLFFLALSLGGALIAYAFNDSLFVVNTSREVHGHG